MREFLAALGVEIGVGVVVLVSILVGVLWRKLERRIDANQMAITEGRLTIGGDGGLRERLAKLETWRDEHANADLAIHSRLELALERQLEATGMFRTESAEQARAMLDALDVSSKEARTGRGEIRDEVRAVTGKVERLIGAQEERDRRGAV